MLRTYVKTLYENYGHSSLDIIKPKGWIFLRSLYDHETANGKQTDSAIVAIKSPVEIRVAITDGFKTVMLESDESGFIAFSADLCNFMKEHKISGLDHDHCRPYTLNSAVYFKEGTVENDWVSKDELARQIEILWVMHDLQDTTNAVQTNAFYGLEIIPGVDIKCDYVSVPYES